MCFYFILSTLWADKISGELPNCLIAAPKMCNMTRFKKKIFLIDVRSVALKKKKIDWLTHCSIVQWFNVGWIFIIFFFILHMPFVRKQNIHSSKVLESIDKIFYFVMSIYCCQHFNSIHYSNYVDEFYSHANTQRRRCSKSISFWDWYLLSIYFVIFIPGLNDDDLTIYRCMLCYCAVRKKKEKRE